MRSRTANWFLCKIRYEKTMEDGLQKRVTEQYVVDAISFTEAEARIIEEISTYISGEFEVLEIDRAVYKEIFFMYDATTPDASASGLIADKWYKAKLKFITIDERTEKEKKTTVYYLVQAASFEGARRNIDEVMGGTMNDYIIDTVSETSIMDVFENITPAMASNQQSNFK